MFARVLEKAGMFYPQQTVEALFSEYDTNQNGIIDYREFATMLFGSSL